MEVFGIAVEDKLLPVKPSVKHTRQREANRILSEYDRRQRDIPADFYSPFKVGILFAYQQRTRTVLRTLQRDGITTLQNLRILDVGCGRGGWIADFETWGARRENIAGIDLVPRQVKETQARFPDLRDEMGQLLTRGADIRLGDASTLPWPDANFDLVLQSTVFSSILDQNMRQALAHEMTRVLKPGGYILWYDLRVNNPANRQVKGIGRREIRAMFPGFKIQLEHLTLAPPIARALAPISWLAASILEKAKIFNTHYCGLFKRV